MWKPGKGVGGQGVESNPTVETSFIFVRVCVNPRRRAPLKNSFNVLAVENIGSLIQAIANLVEKSVQISLGLAEFGNFGDGMQNGCVMLPAELPADLGQRGCGQLLG